MDPTFDSESALSVQQAVSDAPHAVALRVGTTRVTFEQLWKRVAERMKSLKRPRPGRPFSIVCDNSFECLVTLYALMEAQIPALLLHPSLTDQERASLLENISAIDEPLPSNAAFVVFTSGTTGKAKAAILTRENMLSSASSSAQNITLSENDAWLMSLSTARVGGLSILTRCLLARSCIVLAPHFSAKGFVAAVQSNDVTLASIVPTMLIKLLEEEPTWVPPPGFRAILLGGAGASPTLLSEARRRGIPIITTYGMTETASNVVTTPYASRLDGQTVNQVNAHAEVRIIDGRIHVRGPMRMYGYWGHPPLNASDWFDTGDIGSIDANGTLHVYARRTDVINSGGENVYPAEVENVLDSIPGIRSSMVLGFPDDTWGAIVVALLVAEDAPLSAETLKTELVRKLSTYKCPRRICWVRQLPCHASGKPNRDSEVLKNLPLQTIHYKH